MAAAAAEEEVAEEDRASSSAVAEAGEETSLEEEATGTRATGEELPRHGAEETRYEIPSASATHFLLKMFF